MNLRTMLAAVHVMEAHGDLDVEVLRAVRDSRKVQAGDVFCAHRGFYSDGHAYIADAVARGAAAVVLQDRSAAPEGVPWARVASGQAVLAVLADALHDHPSRKLLLCGVTGTNGKTTTCHLLASIFAATSRKWGLQGTTGAIVDGVARNLGLTTPEAPELQALLADMAGAGVELCTMEVSSHGIAMDRVHATAFAVGVFTGIGRDHLDFHGSMEEYAETKVNWFLGPLQDSPTLCGAVVPADDPYGMEIHAEFRGPILTFGFDEEADIYPSQLELGPTGSQGRLVTPAGTLSFRLPVPGRHNVRNAMAAIGAAQLLGIEPIAQVEGIQRFRGVRGRLESVPNERGLTVLVDYAHTPDALETTIASLREVTDGRLIVVFGCGGDRDREKRPEMGRVVQAGADISVVTSDNPRSEAPDVIIGEILLGIPVDADPATLHVESDRETAIRRALALAVPGDVVLIAGKGHETVQVHAHGAVDFDDREVAARVLAEGPA